jgi:tetratricopeptide (TPR) repeat protein
MSKILISLGVAVLVTISSFAQGTFRVLSAKGDNVMQKGTEYVPLGPGTQLPANAKIMLGENAVVELTNSKNQTITLNKAGIYTMNDLSGDFKSDNSSLAQRYLTYVFNEMANKSDSRTASLAITGSVERSLNDEVISIYCPESTYIMSKETSFKWDAKNPGESYKVVVKNLFDEEVISQVVDGNEANLDLTKIEFEEDAIYKFIVVDPANPSNKSSELILRIPTQEELTHINNDLNEMEKEADSSSPLYYALLAKYCKVNGLYADAVSNYEKALALAPDSEIIKMEYESFLKEAGVKE